MIRAGGGHNPWLVAPVVAMAAFMEVLDISIANVALQHIAGDLSASQDESTWILTSYLVTNAIVLPMSGWLSAVMGRKRFFLVCITAFSIASLLCGLAPSLGVLIVFRALQGLAGGGLQPLAQAILTDAFPAEKRGMAFALFGMSVVLAPAIGPTLGGWITDSASWRWVFLINVPVGAALVPLVTAMIADPPHAVAARAERLKRGIRIDWIGFGLLTLWIGSAQIALDKGQQDDWLASPLIATLAVVAAVGLIAFVIWELGEDDPIVDVRLLADRNFAAANALMLALGTVLFSTTVLLPLLVQSFFGYTATLAGLVITPGGVTILFLMPLVGRMMSRVDVRWMILAGLLINAYALHRMAGFSAGTDYATFAEARIIQAAGLSLLFIPINTLASVGLPKEKTNEASALINLSRNLGGSVGISAVVTMLSRYGQAHQTVLAAHAYSGSPAYRQALQGMAAALAGHGASLAEAAHQAQAHAYGAILGQASLLAFLDDFNLMAALFLAFIPLILLMRRPDLGGSPGPAH
ncbi:MAG: DHA2 family efflux MFS transporter permease subunit [Magnetospirillum sp.]|nr:DHA2 family efflux MFS transporter permease subunit [Magnetospirillum sp.]